MFKVNNSKHLFVTKLAPVTANVSGGTKVQGYADLNDGAVAVVYADGTIFALGAGITTATAPYRFVKRVGTELYYSNDIVPANVIANAAGAKAAQIVVSVTGNNATEELYYIGYNGANIETIDVINNNEYLVRLMLKDNLKTFGDKLMYKFGKYTSTSTATSYAIANGVVSNLVDNFKRESEKTLKFGVINSAAGVASSGGTAAVTNGSKYFTIAESAGGQNDAGKYAADASTIAVGDYVRFGTATTASIYKVLSVATAGTALCTIGLDRPVEYATTAALAAASLEVVAAAAYGTYTGISIQGVARTNFVPGTFKYYKHRFEITLGEFGTTLLDKHTPASEGIGSAFEAAEQEWYGWGAWGKFMRIQTPPVTFPQTPATTYTEEFDIVEVKYKNSSDGLITSVNTPSSVVLYYLNGDAASYVKYKV